MLGAFAGRENMRIAGTHLAIDDDAACRDKPGFSRERDVRTNADCDHHKVSGKMATVGEFHTADLPLARNARRPCGTDNLYTACFEFAL